MPDTSMTIVLQITPNNAPSQGANERPSIRFANVGTLEGFEEYARLPAAQNSLSTTIIAHKKGYVYRLIDTDTQKIIVDQAIFREKINLRIRLKNGQSLEISAFFDGDEKPADESISWYWADTGDSLCAEQVVSSDSPVSDWTQEAVAAWQPLDALPLCVLPLGAATETFSLLAVPVASSLGAPFLVGVSSLAAASLGSSQAVTAAVVVTAVDSNWAMSVANGPIEFTVTFSGPIRGSVNRDSFTASGGEVTAVEDLGNNQYKVRVSPEAGVASGKVSLQLVAEGLSNSAGEAMSSADLSNFVRQDFDTLAPSVSVTSKATSVHAESSALLTFTFTEAPLGLDFSDLIVSNGSIGNWMVSAQDPRVYTADFTPANPSQGVASIQVKEASYTDAAGNSGRGGELVLQLLNDPPVVTAGAASAPLVEAGGVNNALAGTAVSRVQLTLSDTESTPVYDEQLMRC